MASRHWLLRIDGDERQVDLCAATGLRPRDVDELNEEQARHLAHDIAVELVLEGIPICVEALAWVGT